MAVIAAEASGLADMCTTSEFQRCCEITLAQSHHFLIDGPRSSVVMFGVEPYVGHSYTRHKGETEY